MSVPPKLNVAEVLLVAAGGCEEIEVSGATRSIAYTSPPKDRLTMTAEMPVPLTMFRAIEPVPVPVLAVTVHEVAKGPPIGVTDVIAGDPPSPPTPRLKLLATTFVTAFVKVTVHCTELKLVGDVWTRVIELTPVGIVTSAVAGAPSTIASALPVPAVFAVNVTVAVPEG